MNKINFSFLAFFSLVLLGFTYSYKNKTSSENTGSLNQSQQNVSVDVDKEELFQRRWSYVSETSAVIYWQLGDISSSARSYIEYGKTEKLGLQTQITKKPRLAQYHQLKNLDPETRYYYRMVVIDPENGQKTQSEIIKINLRIKQEAIRIPEDMPGPMPYILNKPGALYILTKDITAKGTAIEIAGKGVTLDLDGHTVIFGDDSDEQVYGVRFADWGKSVLCNGFIVQGKRSRDYSAAITSLDRTVPTEIFGISTDVHLPNAFPVYMSHANKVNIHHNYIYSRVTEIECRHYPGNVLMRIYTYAGDIHIHDNLLTEGCHWGIKVRKVSQTIKNVEIDHNDIQHHQQYVNGYAISPSEGALVHHNKITSSGRGIHVTKNGVQVYNNYIDTKGHQQLSDYPAKTRPFQHRLIECHGIKLEGRNTKNCKIYNNFVRITQYLPADSDGQGLPEDKMDNGVFIRSTATSLSAEKLVDSNQNWEENRWRFYYVKYNPDLPPAKITGNDATTLFADFGEVKPSEYTIYMKWTYVPPTPLNIACYDPNGMNEIYNNTFTGTTRYKKTRHGDYGDTGEWATSLMFIWMKYGPADSGKYSAYIHNNQFFSNDLFLNTGVEVNMTLRLEENTFNLFKKPFATDESNRIRGVGPGFEKQVRSGNNIFKE